MKIQNYKSSKTKFIARVMIVVLLLTSTLNLSGCLRPVFYKYIQIAETDGHVRPAFIRVLSNTNIYDIDDLTLNLEIGLHSISLFSKSGKEQYAYSSYETGFAIYISDGIYEDDFPSTASNLRHIDNHYYVDEITEDEAFSIEYGYNRFLYNHKRKIKIPSKFLMKDRGSVAIKLAHYYIFGEWGDQWEYFGSKYDFDSSYSIYVIVLEYEKTEDGRVMITNFYEK